MGVPVEEALSDTGMNYRIALVHLECDCKEYWIR